MPNTGTPYEAVYNRALGLFQEYKWLKFTDNDKLYLLRQFLHQAQNDMSTLCAQDVQKYDDDNQCFEHKLPEDVIDILAYGVAFYWLGYNVNSSENLRNYLSTKDFTYFSPANLLREMTTLRKQIYVEYRRKLVEYTYNHADIVNLKP